MARLDPPPLTSPMTQKDGTLSPAWARWLSLLQSVLAGYATPSGTQTPTLQNSWSNRGSPFHDIAYWKDAAGLVHLIGGVVGGTLGSAAFTLPAGFRPGASLRFAVCASTGSADQADWVEVGSDGTVKPFGTGSTNGGTTGLVDLSGISFPAAQ